MAWTNPKTWTAGPLTSTDLNTQVRDNLNAIGGTWSTWTPTWTAPTTNPAGGTFAASYINPGKLVISAMLLTMGSGTTYGSGAWEFSLPVPPDGGYSARSVLGSGFVVYGSTNVLAVARLWTSTTCRISIAGGDLSAATTAWATGDSVSLQLTYKGA